MSVTKVLHGVKEFKNLGEGSYEVAVRKTGAPWAIVHELGLTIPSSRKADMVVEVRGQEKDL